MATDTDPLFRALAEDADRARLEPPGDLRRRGDRRTALRAALGAVTVVAVVASVVLGGSSLIDRSSGPVVVDTPMPTPTAARHRTPTSIPSSAFLSAADLNDSADPIRSDALPPPGCEVLMSTADGEPGQLVVARTVHGFYRAPELTLDFVPDGTVLQQIQVYGNAGRSLEVIKHCQGQGLVPSGSPDVASLYTVGDGWLAVVRVRHTLSVLLLQGWEGTPATEGDARRLAAAAAARLHAWLD
jgi:hypothetical protein